MSKLMNSTIRQFTVLGERCSGTNFLENIVIKNLKLEITWDFGWKHWFGFDDFTDSDRVLFLGILRDPVQWMQSLFSAQYHIAPHLRENIRDFLQQEWWSCFDKPYQGDRCGQEIMRDRNMHTKQRYGNIFEMMSTKCLYLLDEMPRRVSNFKLIRYEDLKEKPLETLKDLSSRFELEMADPDRVLDLTIDPRPTGRLFSFGQRKHNKRAYEITQEARNISKKTSMILSKRDWVTVESKLFDSPVISKACCYLGHRQCREH